MNKKFLPLTQYLSQSQNAKFLVFSNFLAVEWWRF